jgi:hypothetical protein
MEPKEYWSYVLSEMLLGATDEDFRAVVIESLDK